jgi:hypothetical protein
MDAKEAARDCRKCQAAGAYEAGLPCPDWPNDGQAMTIYQFIERHGISITANRVGTRPAVGKDEWMPGTAHWHVTLKCGNRTLSVYYSKGPGLRVWRKTPRDWDLVHDRPKDARPGKRAQLPFNAKHYDRQVFDAWTDPEPVAAADVLDSLAHDASSADQSFGDWCGDYGYDTDSRKAERTYNACRQTMFDLRKLLGARDAEVLIQEVERL